jgi:hypothetical protein
MIMDIVKIFCQIDDFCKVFLPELKKQMLADTLSKKRNRESIFSTSEVMTIAIFFHISNYRNFKYYYLNIVLGELKELFPRAVSYNRFIELMQSAIVPMIAFMQCKCYGECSGISFIDSTILKACHNRRIHSNKVFKNIAERGKSSTGWFYGFKLHLVINDKGEILSCVLTAGNIDDRDESVINPLTENLFGKLIGDKGYLSQKIFDSLFARGIQLITKIRKNMKNKLMLIEDKLLLRKRAVIESVNDQLKNISQIEHSRHRSVSNFFVNVLSGIIAYSFREKKPSIFSNANILACL